MKKKININELAELNTDKLKEIWQNEFKNKPIPKHKSKLVKELAYLLQAKEFGDLDKNTKVTLARRMNTFEKKLKGKQVKSIPSKNKTKLEAGAIITREWKGSKLQVEVISDNEFKFNEQTFKSLTAIAKHITGQHLSGPRFFNIKEES